LTREPVDPPERRTFWHTVLDTPLSAPVAAFPADIVWSAGFVCEPLDAQATMPAVMASSINNFRTG
jgi:hypothetical protein